MKYDERLIQKNIRYFQTQHFAPEEVDLYWDLDNTLALFNIYGKQETALKQMWNKGFYKNLQPFPNVSRVLSDLQSKGFNNFILSSVIDSAYCAEEKILWVNNILPFIPQEHIILIPNGVSKAKCFYNPQSSILIDDYNVNLKEAYKAGAIGVKKTYSNKSRPIPQIGDISEIYGVLANLNCL